MAVQREKWGSRFGFVLAAAGSAIGLGNLWRFPYVTHENGGGVFVLMYLVAVVLVGYPLLVSEMVLGRGSQRNAVGAFLHHERPTRFFFHYHREDGRPYIPAWLIGAMGILTGFLILSFYSVVAGWTLEYAIRGFSGSFKGMDLATSQALFSAFTENPYKQVFYFAIFALITVVIISRGVTRGIEAINKVLLPVLFALVVGLGIYSLKNFDAVSTFRFLFAWDLSKVTPHSALEALGQAFFSLSLGMGAILTYGSYMRKERNIFVGAGQVALADSAIAFLACMVMYPIIFSNVQAAEDFQSLSMLFTTLPVILAELPFGSQVVGLFYTLVALAAITSTISLLEVITAYWVDERGWNRKKTAWVMGGVVFLFGIPSALCQGSVKWLSSIHLITVDGEGKTWMQTFEYLTANWFLPLGGLAIALFTGWYVLESALRDQLIPRGGSAAAVGFYRVWRWLIRYLSPILIFLVMLYILGILSPSE